MNNFYIYIYLDPREYDIYEYGKYKFEYKPFYIGKGKDGRIKNIKDGRSDNFINIINKIKEIGLTPIYFKLYENLTEEESFELEKKFINEIGRLNLGTGPLINKTSGGQGNSGYKFSEEIREIISKKQRKNFQDIKKEFIKRNYILLSEENEYINNKTKLNYICPKGHNNSIKWINFQQGQDCSYCTKNKINFLDIKKKFEGKNYILLTKENEYKNAHKKLNYICNRGHEYYISWSDFKQEKSCPICKLKLIIQDVVQIKLLLKGKKLIQKQIASIFEISETTISAIKTGKIWSHIKLGEN